MTKAQLQDFGIEINKWTDLKGLCRGILFDNEGSLFVSPKTMQFYFDTNNELIFVRYTSDHYRKDTTLEGNKNFYKVTYEGNNYYSLFVPGGVDDSVVGRYHIVYDLNKMIMIF